VLVVDDEPAIATLVARHLERTDGVSVTAVSDPESAVSLAGERRFDCVVSDYEMPRIDGFDLLRSVREDDPTVPFILYTAVSADEILDEALERGVTELVEKSGREQFAVLGRRVSAAVEGRPDAGGPASVDRDWDPEEAGFPDGEAMFVVDRTGSIEYLSAPFLDLTGYGEDELLGVSWEVLFPALEMQRLLDEVLPVVAREGGWSGASTAVGKSGRPMLEATSIEHIEDGSLFVLVVDLESMDAPDPSSTLEGDDG
jgi:PAS domain S-box-containing protein